MISNRSLQELADKIQQIHDKTENSVVYFYVIHRLEGSNHDESVEFIADDPAMQLRKEYIENILSKYITQ